MNRETFLNQLAAELAGLAPADRKQVLDYYNEMILDGAENGIPEEEMLNGLGSPEEIAAQVQAEYAVRQESRPPAGPDASADMPPAEPLEYVFSADGPRRLEVRAGNTRIELRRAPAGQLRVLAYGCRKEWLTPEADDEAFRLTLRVPAFYANGWYALMTGERRKLVVELPEGFADGVQIKTSNASITGEGLLLKGTAKLKTSCSHIELESCRFDKLKANTCNSTINLSGLVGQTCRAQTTNAHIKAEDCHFAKKLLLDTTNAPVRVADIEAPEISLTSTNGAIKGWVRGREDDYAVTSGTSNARNELRDTSDRMDRPCRLRAETSNAKIKLTFAADDSAV